MKATENFFEERSEASQLKAQIVSSYFGVWAKVVGSVAEKRGGKIAYIDLYAGPGRYKDGSKSTPLMVLETAINDPKIARMLVTYFNDAVTGHATTLQDEINKLPGIEKLKYKPTVANDEIDEGVANYLNSIRLVPTFSFIDPFGYKGLSLQIVKSVIKDWGCDCVFFFNYARINAGVSNPNVTDHIDALFGKSRADVLRTRLPGLTPELREAAILEVLATEIKAQGGNCVLPFTFKNPTGKRSTHHLIFVSKDPKGYEIMKEIMAKRSSMSDQGVPSFQYSPADASMPLLFSLTMPIAKLKESLLTKYTGRELSLDQIYRDHNLDTPYIRANYKEVIGQLEAEGIVSAASIKGKRVKNTYPDHVLIKFP